MASTRRSTKTVGRRKLPATITLSSLLSFSRFSVSLYLLLLIWLICKLSKGPPLLFIT
ncbi:hypothetical protein Hanom_Chr10g00915761 [Helianthus anomalus]